MTQQGGLMIKAVTFMKEVAISIIQQRGLMTNDRYFVTQQEGLMTKVRYSVPQQEGLMSKVRYFVTQQEGLMTKASANIIKPAAFMTKSLAFMINPATSITKATGLTTKATGFGLEFETLQSSVSSTLIKVEIPRFTTNDRFTQWKGDSSLRIGMTAALEVMREGKRRRLRRLLFPFPIHETFVIQREAMNLNIFTRQQ